MGGNQEVITLRDAVAKELFLHKIKSGEFFRGREHETAEWAYLMADTLLQARTKKVSDA